MASASAQAFGLPTNIPLFVEDPLAPRAMFAIFHTAPLTAETRQELEEAINFGRWSYENCKLAPTADFSNRSLRDVFDYFIALRESDSTIQPFYFIVADRPSFREEGVLGVWLDCTQGGDSDVGVARCGIDSAESWGVRFCLGLAKWEEMKASETLDWGDDSNVKETDPEKKHAEEATKYGRNTRTYAIQDRDWYGWYSLVKNAVPVNTMLNPLWMQMTPEQCRFQMLGNYHSSSDPWTDICREHPQEAAFRPRVHRAIVLVAEKEDADQEDGITIVLLESERSPRVLAKVGAGRAISEADRLVRELGL